MATARQRCVTGIIGQAFLHTQSSRTISSSLPLLLASAIDNQQQTCTLIPGDGVGPELMSSVEAVCEAMGTPISFDIYHLSELHPALSSPIKVVADSIRRNKLCLKGILDTPSIYLKGRLETVNQMLRKELDLYANVVRVQSVLGVKTRHANLDFVIIREQIEGEYSALEYECVNGVVECLKIVTAKRSRRIAKFAFDYATKHGRSKVTAIHKANIMKLGDGLFLRSCQEIAELYPNIQFETMIVDNCTMQLVSNPQQFDVLVTPNLYGHVINNLGVGLVGGAGIVAGESYSEDSICFEPGARHAYSEAAGKNVANPTAMLLATANMFNSCNLEQYGATLTKAVSKVLKDGKVRTKDINGHSTTQDFTKAVIRNL